MELNNKKNQIAEIQNKIFTEEFEIFCDKEFEEKMQELNSKRKFYIAEHIFFIIVAIVFHFSFLYFLNKYNWDFEVLKYLYGIIMVFITLPIISIPSDFKTKSKWIVMRKLFSFIGTFNFCYEREKLNFLRNLSIWGKCDRWEIHDRIKGKYGDLSVDIIELSLYKQSEKDEKKSDGLIFKGLMIKVPSFKKFKGITYTKEEAIYREIKRPFAKVNLEDPEFEKLYDAYSTDQVEARYLITAAFMDRLVQVSKKNGRKILVLFENKNIYLFVPSYFKDWFEIPLYSFKRGTAQYRAIILELLTLLKIIETLKLEQKIGM